MDTNQAARGLRGSQSADRTALGSNARPLDPESSFGAFLSHSQRERFDQMALNYSRSHAAISSTQSHQRDRKGDGLGAQGQGSDAMDSLTESGIATDASFYSYRSARDLSAFVKEIDGRFVCSFMRSLCLIRYLECLITSQSFTSCQVVSIPKQLAESHTKTRLDDPEFQRLCVPS
jgi:hypothetical protein